MMGLKIRNDYQYTDIDNSLNNDDDVKDFWKKIREIKKDLRLSIEAGKLEIIEKDNTAKSMISSINIYYKLCCIQLVIIIIVTVYTVVTYQEFFKKKSII